MTSTTHPTEVYLFPVESSTVVRQDNVERANRVSPIFELKQWNVGSAVTPKPTNTAKCPMDINAIFAPTANKPSTEQVWQGVGADESDGAVSGELFQLDLAAQPPQGNGSATSRID